MKINLFFFNLLFCILLAPAILKAKQIYWLDIRLPGEYLFGGKRKIFLKPKVPSDCRAVLTVVEKFDPVSRKIEPLVATEYYSFPIKNGFYVCIPKHSDVYVRPDIESLGARFQNFSLETEFKFILLLLRVLLEDETTPTAPATDFRIFAKDFCKRLSLVYPRHNALPCCDGKTSFETFMNQEISAITPSERLPFVRRKVFFTLRPIKK
jgi:hypothetical protein